MTGSVSHSGLWRSKEGLSQPRVVARVTGQATATHCQSGQWEQSWLGIGAWDMQVESLPAESAVGSPRLKLTDCYQQGNFLL